MEAICYENFVDHFNNQLQCGTIYLFKRIWFEPADQPLPFKLAIQSEFLIILRRQTEIHPSDTQTNIPRLLEAKSLSSFQQGCASHTHPAHSLTQSHQEHMKLYVSSHITQASYYMGGVVPLFILVHDPLDCCHVAQSKPYTLLLEYSTNSRYFILLLNILLQNIPNSRVLPTQPGYFMTYQKLHAPTKSFMHRYDKITSNIRHFS